MNKYIKLEDAINNKCPCEDIWENCINCPLDNGGIEPCKMGKWLKSLPTIEVSEDAISREWVKGICESMLDEEMLGHMLGYIEDAPSVVPKPKEGEWIETSEGTMCGNCHKFPYDDGEYHIANWHSDFCPNCGAKMKGAE